MKDLQTILELSKRSNILTSEFFEDLKECTTYGSMGTFNWVINVLQIVKERIENKQMNRINEFAGRNNMIIMHTIRYGIMGPMVRREKFDQAIRFMRSGKADAIVTTNVWNISEGIRDGYDKLGAVHEAGFNLYSIDDKETRLNLYIPPLSIEKGV